VTDAATGAPQEARSDRSRWLRPLLALLLIGALVAVWHYSGVRELDSVSRVAEAVRELRASRFAFAYVLGAFVLASLVFIPISLLQVGTVLALGPLEGAPCAYVGTLVSAGLGYGIGHLLGQDALERIAGQRLRRVYALLQGRAFHATVVARLMPIGNFNVINLIAGSLAIPFRWFVLGNAVGILPGLTLIALFVEQVARWLG
jgi:phospholipase D1/2